MPSSTASSVEACSPSEKTRFQFDPRNWLASGRRKELVPIDRIELPKVSDCCSQCVRPGKTQLQVELDQDAGHILSRTSLSQRRFFFNRWLPRNNAHVPCLAFASTYHMAEIKDICLAPPNGFRSNAENRGRMAYFGSRARASIVASYGLRVAGCRLRVAGASLSRWKTTVCGHSDA